MFREKKQRRPGDSPAASVGRTAPTNRQFGSRGTALSDTAADKGGELIEGSMQAFVEFDTTAGDLSINVLPPSELRKIAILDVYVK